MNYKMPDLKYIVVEGNIGAGKTSLAHLLAEHFNGKLLLEEFADNTFLPQFYNDPDRFAFPLEMSFMAERYSQLKLHFDQTDKSKMVVADYVFEKSLLFAKVNLKKNEFQLLQNFFDMMKEALPKPDLLIYLKKDVHHLKKNIQKRGRDFEQNIKADYLTQIDQSYQQFLASNNLIPKIIIDTTDLDFVTNKKDFDFIIKKIKNN